MAILSAAMADMTSEETRSFYVGEYFNPKAQAAYRTGFAVFSTAEARDTWANAADAQGYSVIVYPLLANFGDDLIDAQEWLRENCRIGNYFDIGA